MQEIPLSPSGIAFIDDADYPAISQYKWHRQVVRVAKLEYAWRSERVEGKSRCIYMHRQLLDAPKGMMVDHVDRNGLNNCRHNIRLCSNQQNQYNARRKADNTSGFKGVHRLGSGWAAHIKVDGKKIYLGTFSHPALAAHAYNAAAIRYCGEFARLNTIPNDIPAILLMNSRTRGRKPIDARSYRSVLTEDQIREIRNRHASEHVSITTLAREYRVHRMTISRIVNGLRWKHLVA